EPLLSGQEFSLKIQWSYLINNSKLIGGRTGYEPFEKDGNSIYEIAQWFPRLAAFTDVTGWQHKQYLGQGEFTLEFGDYLVRITAPADHIVAATGELQNPNEVLSEAQRERLEQARTAERPVLIVTPEEAKENEKEKSDQLKTWIFRAEAVRDFAFATSRKFIWDAQGHRVNDNFVMAMSYYPNEGNPLWSKYYTHAIIHTLNVYSRYTFDYPYPVAISVNGPVGGMEYPMICFNGPRPREDGTYSASTKYDLITVIIQEVGHNDFPMIVNSDELQWSWM
ncbi:MAG: aminopeptidase, partial [Pirellula sp.]